MSLKFKYIFPLLAVLSMITNCSSTIEGLIVDSMVNSLNDDQNITFTGEEDPDLMGEALPFMLKMNEIMMSSSPDNENLKLSAVRGFVTYASKWLEFDARKIEDEDYDKAAYLRLRAQKLYLRAKNYGFQGLEIEHENFLDLLKKSTTATLDELEVEDVPLLTWTGLAWISYISQSTDNPSVMVELPIAIKMLEKAISLDEKFEAGFLHEFFVLYYGTGFGGHKSIDRARVHFEKAVEVSNAQKCSPYLGWATSYAINEQNEKVFDEMIKKSLSIDPNQIPSFRLANQLCQREALWYKENKDNYFL